MSTGPRADTQDVGPSEQQQRKAGSALSQHPHTPARVCISVRRAQLTFHVRDRCWRRQPWCPDARGVVLLAVVNGRVRRRSRSRALVRTPVRAGVVRFGHRAGNLRLRHLGHQGRRARCGRGCGWRRAVGGAGSVRCESQLDGGEYERGAVRVRIVVRVHAGAGAQAAARPWLRPGVAVRAVAAAPRAQLVERRRGRRAGRPSKFDGK